MARSKAAQRLIDEADALQIRGLRGVRTALSTTRGRLDIGAPKLDTRELSIPTPAGPMRARLYLPDGSPAPGPVLVFFHGGGFVVCDIDSHDALCRRLAEAAGIRIISVDYRLAPEAPFPAQLEDGEEAVRWAIAEAASLQIDAGRLMVGGDSAGGYISVWVASKLNAERPGSVAGQVLIYPLLELEDEAWAASLATHSRIIGRVALSYIRRQLQLGAIPPSLAGGDLAPMPPTLIAVGGHLDPCRPEGLALAERLAAAGKQITLLRYPRLPHGFASITHLYPASGIALAEIGRRAAQLLDSDAPSTSPSPP